MLKHFRVPGRLAVKLEDLGVSVPTVLRKAGLPRDLFEQTACLSPRRSCLHFGVPSIK